VGSLGGVEPVEERDIARVTIVDRTVPRKTPDYAHTNRLVLSDFFEEATDVFAERPEKVKSFHMTV
jgi:hypothetical protein